MTYESPYGKQEGLRERIQQWIDRLSKDQSLPWVGLGLIADLEAVKKNMDTRFDL